MGESCVQKGSTVFERGYGRTAKGFLVGSETDNRFYSDRDSFSYCRGYFCRSGGLWVIHNSWNINKVVNGYEGKADGEKMVYCTYLYRARGQG